MRKILNQLLNKLFDFQKEKTDQEIEKLNLQLTQLIKEKDSFSSFLVNLVIYSKSNLN